MICDMLYKPAGGLLAGFSLLPYVPMSRHVSRRTEPYRAARIALYNLPKMNGLFLCNFFVDKLLSICYNQNDLWITYEEGGEDRLVKCA